MAIYVADIDVADEAIENLQNNDSFKDFETFHTEVSNFGVLPFRKTGAFAATYHVKNSKTHKEFAFRVWTKDIPKIIHRSQLISDFLVTHKSSYFVGYQIHEESLKVSDNMVDVLLMDWVPGETLFDYVLAIIKEHKESEFYDIAIKIKEMFRWMHQNKVVHGDLQHNNIMIVDGNPILIDYDSMAIPSMGDCEKFTDGLAGYHHPLLKTRSLSSKFDDYIAEIIIYMGLLSLSIDSRLWAHEEKDEPEYFILTPKNLESISNNDVSSLEKFLNLTANSERQQKIIDEIKKLVDLLVSNLQCENYEDMKPMPGISNTYCRICGAPTFASYNYCPNCGCHIYKLRNHEN